MKKEKNVRWSEINWWFNLVWLYMAVSFNRWKNKLFKGVYRQPSVRNWQLPLIGFEPQRRGASSFKARRLNQSVTEAPRKKDHQCYMYDLWRRQNNLRSNLTWHFLYHSPVCHDNELSCLQTLPFGQRGITHHSDPLLSTVIHYVGLLLPRVELYLIDSWNRKPRLFHGF